MVENLTGERIKCLRTDNGGEYLSKAFNDHLKKKGIKRQLTLPGTPQQNGVAERADRTIQETARSMLCAAKLPDSFWAEAVLTAVILKNRSPTIAVKDATPYEEFTGDIPDVSNLRVFGCTAYMHIPKERRHKWDYKSTKCIFIGYSICRKAYRLWNPDTKTVHESRDVIFMEKDFNNRTVAERSVQESNSKATPVCEEDMSDEEASIDKNQDVQLERNEEEVIEEDQPPLRRSCRVTKAPDKLGMISGNWWECEDALYTYSSDILEEPKTFEEALESTSSLEWQQAMNNEIESHKKNETWTLEELPTGRKAIDCRWVYKIKHNADGSVERYKARLVAKGYSQQEGIDYEETFSPVARYTTIRSIIAIANQLDLELHQMDVATAFLNGTLKEEIFMKQPEGYAKKNKENLVCKLQKSIYGLKQASRCWYNTMHNFLKELDYKQCSSDTCLYTKQVGANFVIIALFVDDLLIASNNMQLLQNEKRLLSGKFEMKDLGEAHYILGIQIKRDRSKKLTMLHQSKYLMQLLEKFGMKDCRPVMTPQDQNVKLLPNEGEAHDKAKYEALIGSITYAVTGTRPDLAQALGSLSQFCSNPGTEHWVAAKRILRYIKGSLNYGIVYDGSKEKDVKLKASFHLVALVARMSECTLSDRYGRLQRIRAETRRMINFGGNNNTINKTWRSQEGNCYLFYYYEGAFVEQMLSERDFGYERYILNELLIE